MTIVSIVIPSYRRPDRLAQSLRALGRQSRPADEILVVCRREDAETYAVADKVRGVHRVEVQTPGVLAAMRQGATAATGDYIGFVDDDAEPHERWLEGILAHFADCAVGGVSARDIVASDGAKPTTDVGRITAFGKLIGNHHLGSGSAREVEVLKAANMVFRRSALALPDGLHGVGAQVHFEIATSLWAIGEGWRLIYDPGLKVDHFAGPRFDDDARGAPSAAATANAAFNLVLCLGATRPQLRHRRLLYGLLIGDRDAPGLARAARAVLERDTAVVARLVPAVRGQVEAYGLLARNQSVLQMHVYPSAGVEVTWRPAPSP